LAIALDAGEILNPAEFSMWRFRMMMACLALGVSAPLAAQNVAQLRVGAGSVSGQSGASDVMVFFRAQNGGQGGGTEAARVGRAQASFSFPNATIVVLTHTDRCSVNTNQPNRLDVTLGNLPYVELRNQIVCTVRVGYASAVIIEAIPGSVNFLNILGNSVTGFAAGAGLGPQGNNATAPLTILYRPNFAGNEAGDNAPEIVFPRGAIGVPMRRQMRVIAAGGVGGTAGGQIGACATFRPNSQQVFGLINSGSGGWFFGSGTTNDVPIDLYCTPTDEAQTVTLDCVENKTPGVARLRFWDMQCPAGIPSEDFVFADNLELSTVP
jgi:hypothetical protein